MELNKIIQANLQLSNWHSIILNLNYDTVYQPFNWQQYLTPLLINNYLSITYKKLNCF